MSPLQDLSLSCDNYFLVEDRMREQQEQARLLAEKIKSLSENIYPHIEPRVTMREDIRSVRSLQRRPMRPFIIPSYWL